MKKIKQLLASQISNSFKEKKGSRMGFFGIRKLGIDPGSEALLKTPGNHLTS